jgi:hypothetical protein
MVVTGGVPLDKAASVYVEGDRAEFAEMDFALQKNGIFCKEIGDNESISEIGPEGSLADKICNPPRILPSLLTIVLR